MSQGAVGREIALWKWVLVGLVIWVIGYMAVVTRLSIAQRLQTEHQYNEAFLGAAAASHAEGRAAGWFKTLIVDRGLLDHSSFGGSDPSFDSNKSETVRKIGMGIDAAKGWAGARVAVMWAMVYQVLTRLSVSAIWLPYLIVVLVPFVVDGWVLRRIKSGSFGRSSPHAFVFGRHFVFLSPLIYLVLLVVPVPLPAFVLPVLCIVCGVSLWAAIAHFAKRA
ncbi:MAG: hypothetical protein ABS98_15120 [Lysobacteraceae bacterium SCN 69-48]|nr:MAG: hypothetical protein ABS98_15120 [Xanthomonadaceae bacterium SCN 69-48]